jgi:small subunit ribosomal protein S20
MPAPSKRDKQNLKKYEQNKPVRTHLKNLSRNFYRAIDAGDTERATQIRDEAQQVYNKAATKGIIHRNKAFRKTSRFDKALTGSRGES